MSGAQSSQTLAEGICDCDILCVAATARGPVWRLGIIRLGTSGECGHTECSRMALAARRGVFGGDEACDPGFWLRLRHLRRLSRGSFSFWTSEFSRSRYRGDAGRKAEEVPVG